MKALEAFIERVDRAIQAQPVRAWCVYLFVVILLTIVRQWITGEPIYTSLNP